VLVWVALYFLAAAPKARRASFDLARRLGLGGSLGRRLRFAWRHFFTFGALLFDRAVILGGHEDLYEFELHGEEHIRRVLADGRGAVIVTAHLGNWELLGQLLSRLGARVNLVMHDGMQPELKRTMEKMSEGRAFRVLYTDGSPASAAAVLARLARGEIAGMMGDRVLEEQGVPVRFLGGRALFPSGPYALCAASGAPLLRAFALREGRRRYSLDASPPERLEYASPREKRKEIERWAQRFAEALEEFVRAYPAQWGNFFPFWSAESEAE
jgi:predicted LPLAT superfamily acyltransferase